MIFCFFCSLVLLLLTVNTILTHVSAHLVTIMSFCNLCSAAGNKQIAYRVQYSSPLKPAKSRIRLLAFIILHCKQAYSRQSNFVSSCMHKISCKNKQAVDCPSQKSSDKGLKQVFRLRLLLLLSSCIPHHRSCPTVAWRSGARCLISLSLSVLSQIHSAVCQCSLRFTFMTVLCPSHQCKQRVHLVCVVSNLSITVPILRSMW